MSAALHMQKQLTPNNIVLTSEAYKACLDDLKRGKKRTVESADGTKTEIVLSSAGRMVTWDKKQPIVDLKTVDLSDVPLSEWERCIVAYGEPVARSGHLVTFLDKKTGVFVKLDTKKDVLVV
jgi:hypothetical protein